MAWDSGVISPVPVRSAAARRFPNREPPVSRFEPQSAAASTSLLVVIVNYRTADLTIDCLTSLEPQVAGRPGTQVVVVDNASGDDSVDRLSQAVRQRNWGAWAAIQPINRNGGFAAGNNAAIQPALAAPNPPAFLLLLNPDTVVRPGALQKLLEFMQAHPGVGIAGSRLEDPDGQPQRSAFRFPSILGELEAGVRLGLLTRLLSRWVVAPPVPCGPCPTDWVSGACLITRREVFEQVGLMDEGYFMYYEEVDFCRRAARVGWSIWYVPEARVVHLVGQSSGITSRRRRPSYWFDSRRRYFRTHLGRFGATLADLAFATGFATYRLRRAIQRKPDTDPPGLLLDFVRHALRGPSWSRPEPAR